MKLLVEFPEQGIDYYAVLAQLERDIILLALKRSKQNRTDAARLLGLNRTTLVAMMRRAGIPLGKPTRKAGWLLAAQRKYTLA